MTDGDGPADPPHPAPDPTAPLSELASPSAPDAPSALRDAVGAPSELRRERVARDVDDDDERRPRSRRRLYAIGTGVLALAIGIATLAFLGVASSSRYMLTCAPDHVAAEQGRAFPPWGTHTLAGAPWKPVALPPGAECKPRETDDMHELEGWYLELLLERASATLARRDLLEAVPARTPGMPAASPLDMATAQLEQALLLAHTPDRRDQRKLIERLQGDVEYWRAMVRLRDSAGALVDAAKQLDDAATHRPQHVTDAAAWAKFVRELGDELRAGPNAPGAAPPTVMPTTTGAAEPRPQAPQGSALPVEPPAENEQPVDAGVPSGGVLL